MTSKQPKKNELAEAIKHLKRQVDLVSFEYPILYDKCNKKIAELLQPKQERIADGSLPRDQWFAGVEETPEYQDFEKYRAEFIDDLQAAIELAKPYGLLMDNCRRLVAALQGGLDIPDPWNFKFESLVELDKLLSLVESGKPIEQTTRPLEAVHDELKPLGHNDDYIAKKFLDRRKPAERNRLLQKHRSREAAIKSIIRQCQYIRRKRKQQKS